MAQLLYEYTLVQLMIPPVRRQNGTVEGAAIDRAVAAVLGELRFSPVTR